jgi:bifunctional UDP-N-acetylglucosamine pyrophosphorylase/glucosamine-1-phosphate N-acetyltransferase
MKNITTIILAAGESNRILSKRSKIFHDISDRSLIDHVYSLAEKISSKDIVVVCNKKNYLFLNKKFKGAKIVIQKKINGTAEAVISADKNISKKNDVLILYGDVPLVKQSSIKRLIKNFYFSKKIGSLLVFNSENPLGYGRVEIENNCIKKITEEIQADRETKKISICNSGIMICNSKFLFDNINKISNNNLKKEKYLTDLFEIAYKRRNAFGYSFCSEKELLGVNNREDLIKVDLTMQEEIKKRLINKGVTILQPDTVRVSYDTKIGRDSIIEPFVVIKKGVTISKNVTIKSHSVIEGCFVGEDSSVGPSARIRPNSKISKNVKIGNYVEIKNSFIGESSSISHLSYIGDSFIGKKVNIGAGTITCNYDGKKKNKTIIKDNVFVGSNTSLIAPLTIGKNSNIGAGSVITKNVPPNTLAIERSKQNNLLIKPKK